MAVLVHRPRGVSISPALLAKVFCCGHVTACFVGQRARARQTAPANGLAYVCATKTKNHALPARFAPLLAMLAPAVPAQPAAGVTWHEPIEVAAGGGQRGEWRQNESDYDHVDDGTPAIDSAGNVAVAWVDQGRKDVLFQIYAPDGTKRFAEPVNVSRTPTVFSWLPRIVMTPDAPREVFILWQEIVFSGGSHGGEIFFARSRDGGASFAAPINLSNSIAGDGKGRIDREHWDNGSLDLAMGPEGNVYAAWTEYEGALWFSRSMDRGAHFARPQRVAGTETQPARGPSLATARDGAVYLAWTVGEDPGADIRVARSDNRGEAFEKPVIAHRTRGYSDAPKLAVDRAGTAHLVYAESEGGPFAVFRIRYTRSVDRARTFAPPRVISEPRPNGIANASYPHLSLGGVDTLHVCWELAPNTRGRFRGIGFAQSKDGGETFTTPTVVPHSADPRGGFNGSHQGLLMRKLAANTSGDLALVNSSLKRNDHSRAGCCAERFAGGAAQEIDRSASPTGEAPTPRFIRKSASRIRNNPIVVQLIQGYAVSLNLPADRAHHPRGGTRLTPARSCTTHEWPTSRRASKIMKKRSRRSRVCTKSWPICAKTRLCLKQRRAWTRC